MLAADTTPADLEIRIFPPEPGAGTLHRVEVTFGGDRELAAGTFDATALSPEAGSPEEQGERLFGALFADPDLRCAWAEARGASPARRLRLRIDPEAAALHTLPWELLCEPAQGQEPARLLAADATTPFSRYLAGAWKAGQPVLDRPLRLLAALVNPPGLPSHLPPVDVAAERASLEAALAEAPSGTLEVSWLEGPVTPADLAAELQKGPHFLHLVAHGTFDTREEKGSLWLADPQAPEGSRGVDEDELAELFRGSASPLRLVFLASCRSAQRSPARALRGVAPKLVAAGTPAVVAMQDAVDMETARVFAATFYRRLLDHGRVDRAANEARSIVLHAGLPGPQVPVLFLRLRDGQLLGTRGEIQGQAPETFWKSLLLDIKKKTCTPILGPGVLEGQLPLPAEIAGALADEFNYPFSNRTDLPRVAQFAATDRSDLPHDEVSGLLIRHVHNRWAGPAKAESLTAALRASAWVERSREEETEIHHQLARLPFPLYLTTTADPLMTLALEAQEGRSPRRHRIAWREQPERGDPRAPEPQASEEEPLVFHLFGTDEDLGSLVLTEDDHLDLLRTVSRDEHNLLPLEVGVALSTTNLLFLGYRLRDLDLKILLRGFLLNGLRDWKNRMRVAVQIDPDDVDGTRLAEAKHYLERYFESSQIRVYWGSTRQFVADLCSRYQEESLRD